MQGSSFWLPNPNFSEEPINSSGAGKVVYIRIEIIAKRLTVYETQNTKSICVEIIFKKRM